MAALEYSAPSGRRHEEAPFESVRRAPLSVAVRIPRKGNIAEHGWVFIKLFYENGREVTHPVVVVIEDETGVLDPAMRLERTRGDANDQLWKQVKIREELDQYQRVVKAMFAGSIDKATHSNMRLCQVSRDTHVKDAARGPRGFTSPEPTENLV